MNGKFELNLKKIEEKPELKKKLEELVKNEGAISEVIALCKEFGVSISEEELIPTEELTDDALEVVSGGAIASVFTTKDIMNGLI